MKNTHEMFGYCVEERVSQEVVLKYGSCIPVKMPNFWLLGTKLDVSLGRLGDMINIIGQKGFLADSGG